MTITTERNYEQNDLQKLFGIAGTTGVQNSLSFANGAGKVEVDNRGNGGTIISANIPHGAGFMLGAHLQPDGATLSRSTGILESMNLWRTINAKLAGEGATLERHFNGAADTKSVKIASTKGMVLIDLSKSPDGVMAPVGAFTLGTTGTDGEEPFVSFGWRPLLNTLTGDGPWKQTISGNGIIGVEADGASDITLVPPGESVVIDPEALVACSAGLKRRFGFRANPVASWWHGKHYTGLKLRNDSDHNMFVIQDSNRSIDKHAPAQNIPAAA